MKKTEIGHLLPEVFQDCLSSGDILAPGREDPLSPLDALLGVAELFTEPVEGAYSGLPRCFRPHECDRRFLPFLATWLHVERFVHLLGSSLSSPRTETARESTADRRARQLVEQGTQLARDRGTSAGIIAFLELVTGIHGFRVEEKRNPAGELLPFEVTIICPQVARRSEPLIEEVVRRQKPAYLCCEIAFAEETAGV